MADGQVQAVAVDDDEHVEGAPRSRSSPPLGTQAGKGLRWALVGNLVMKVGSFTLSLAMVRLLAPHDFGLYAVALAANSFLIHVNDAGLIAATVQWRGRVEEMLTTARTMAISFSLAWYALFWVGAPILAGAAGSPDATPLVRLMTLAIVIDGITAVSVGMIQRRFQQDKLMKAIAAGFVANAIVCLSLAVAGAGAYSFVIGALAQSVVVAVLVLWMAHLPFRLALDRVVARRLFVFGIPLAIGMGLESIVLFSDSVIVGHVLGTDELGFYLLAYNISSWVPGLVGAAVRYVSIPAFSRLAGGDGHLLRRRAARPADAGGVRRPGRRGDGDAVAGADRLPLRRRLGRVGQGAGVPGLRDGGPHGHRAGLRHPDRARQHQGHHLAEPDRGAALLPALWIGANTGGIRGAAMAHAAVAFLVAIPLAGLLLHRAGVHMGPVLRRIVRPGPGRGRRRPRHGRGLPPHLVVLPPAAGRGKPGHGHLPGHRGAGRGPGRRPPGGGRPGRRRRAGSRAVNRPARSPLVSIVLPVYNGADTLAPVVESVLAQTHAHVELVISDNASTDGTQELCRGFAREDRRVVYRRQATNVGLLNNFVSAAQDAAGTYLRWIGDDDALEPDYVARVLDAFAEDERRVVVTTQIVYVDEEGVERLDTGYDPTALASADPVERYARMLELLTTDFTTLDPLYAGDPSRGRHHAPAEHAPEDQVFAARLAWPGPGGTSRPHWPVGPARRARVLARGAARRTGLEAARPDPAAVPGARPLGRAVRAHRRERRRAHAEIVRFYGRGKRIKARRGVAKSSG